MNNNDSDNQKIYKATLYLGHAVVTVGDNGQCKYLNSESMNGPEVCGLAVIVELLERLRNGQDIAIFLPQKDSFVKRQRRSGGNRQDEEDDRTIYRCRWLRGTGNLKIYGPNTKIVYHYVTSLAHALKERGVFFCQRQLVDQLPPSKKIDELIKEN